MKDRHLACTIAFLFVFLLIIPVIANAETETITTEDPMTPLKGEPKHVEVGQDGNLIIVTYTGHYGISLIHRNNDTIEHITAPDIESNSVYQIHYNEDDNVLFAITGSGYQAYRTTLETIWLSNGTIQRMWLNYYANVINDLEYNADTNTLYLACNDGLWIIDVGSQNITTKLDKNSGLKPGGILDFFQEPTENLLWFSTTRTQTNMNIQTLDLSTNTISTEIFNVTDIANKSGYTPIGEIFSLLYDTTTRDIYVAFHFNETSTGKDYYLACFDRDDTSKFIHLPTAFLSQGEEITRSGENQVYIETRILDIHPRFSEEVGPFFQGGNIGLFHFDNSNEKVSNWEGGFSTGFELRTFLEPVTYTSPVYDAKTEEYIDVILTYQEPQFQGIFDVVILPETTTAVIADREGVTITDTSDMVKPPTPDPKRKDNIMTMSHLWWVEDDQFSKILDLYPDQKETFEANGVVQIDTAGVDKNDIAGKMLVGRTQVTVTDSNGKVVLTEESDGRSISAELGLRNLPSSEYTVRVENFDWLGNQIDYEERNFILKNKNKDAESDSKLASAALPIFGGLCGLLILIAIIAVIAVTLSKSKKDKISEDSKEE